MKIYPTTLANQPIPTTTESPAFKCNKNLMHRQMAVEVMQTVRSSYSNFESNIIASIIKRLQNQLSQIIKYQEEGGKPIFDKSNIATVKSKITSLKQLIESKPNKA